MALSPLHQHHQQSFYLPNTTSDNQQHLAWNTSYRMLPSPSSIPDQKPIKLDDASANLPMQQNCFAQNGHYFNNNSCHLESKFAYELYQHHQFAHRVDNK